MTFAPRAAAALLVALVWGCNAFAASTLDMKGLLSLGDPAPDFRLMDVMTGRTVSRGDFASKKALLVIILCRHCPYVQRVKQGIAQLGKDYAEKDVGIVAISANDPRAYPDDAPERLKEMAFHEGFVFPVLFDESQETAKAFTAVATPDFFVFDRERKLVYRGQFDEARPGNELAVTGADVRAALDAVLEDRPVPAAQKPAAGCSIKWKTGNEPDYFR